MRSICKAWIPSYFAAMRSERRVMTPGTVKCVSSAYAMLMLCLSLPLTSATIFLRRLLEKELKKDFSKAYAMHMKYIQTNEDDDENSIQSDIWLNVCSIYADYMFIQRISPTFSSSIMFCIFSFSSPSFCSCFASSFFSLFSKLRLCELRDSWIHY